MSIASDTILSGAAAHRSVNAGAVVDHARVLQSLLDNLDGVFYRSRDDEHWTMELLSEGCFRLTGYEPHELLHNSRISYEQITHPEDRARVRQTIRAALEARSCYELEYRLVRADGQIRWVSERGIGLFDAAGAVTAMEGIIYDVTTRKRAEVASREAERRYQSLFDNALDGIFRTSVDGRYLDANPALARIYGFDSPQELIAKLSDIRIQLYVLPTRREEFVAQIRRNGTVSNFESEVHRCDGAIIWISENARAIVDEHGTVVCYEGMVEDISERKQQEQSLIAATVAAQAATRAKSEFLANMSHEIRTPMNGVIGMTQLLLDTPLDPVQRDYAETVRDSAQSLLSVINDILDFSKVEAGKLALDHADVDLRETIEDAARLLAFQAHSKGLEITVQVDANVPDLVMGDAGRIRQVLLNLGSNAVKFTRQGEVALEVSVIANDEHRTRIRVDVRDTGIGIPADRIGALFTPFTQVDGSTTRQFGGTGLGLSITRRLVELMGGETGVASVPGEGSTFWFTATFERAPARATPIRVPPAYVHGRRILVLDDNATNRKVLVSQLLNWGIEPVPASSVDEALRILRQAHCTDRPFDAALVDHQMPGRDGADFGCTINADASLKSLRLVLLTSSGQLSEGDRFAQLGFAAYLLKPVAQLDLLDCLKSIFAHRAEEWHARTQLIITEPTLRGLRAITRTRVLLAEDNVVNQKIAARLLEKLGYRVDIVGDGRAAIEQFRTGHYDLILMDCQMPVIDGYEATREIRRLEQAPARIPIVALTAHAMQGDDLECLEAGMDDYLTKPIDRLKLQSCIEKHIAPP